MPLNCVKCGTKIGSKDVASLDKNGYNSDVALIIETRNGYPGGKEGVNVRDGLIRIR